MTVEFFEVCHRTQTHCYDVICLCGERNQCCENIPYYLKLQTFTKIFQCLLHVLSLPSSYCQMAKLKHFSNGFDVLYSRGNNPQIEGVQCLKGTSEGIFSRVAFI